MENKTQEFLQSVLKGIGIAASGGALTLGAGTINIVDADFGTIVAVSIFCAVVNLAYQYFAKIITQK